MEDSVAQEKVETKERLSSRSLMSAAMQILVESAQANAERCRLLLSALNVGSLTVTLRNTALHIEVSNRQHMEEIGYKFHPKSRFTLTKQSMRVLQGDIQLLMEKNHITCSFFAVPEIEHPGKKGTYLGNLFDVVVNPQISLADVSTYSLLDMDPWDDAQAVFDRMVGDE